MRSKTRKAASALKNRHVDLYETQERLIEPEVPKGGNHAHPTDGLCGVPFQIEIHTMSDSDTRAISPRSGHYQMYSFVRNYYIAGTAPP